MKTFLTTAAVATATLAASGAAWAAEPRIEIRDVVARVTLIPEARGDVKVEILRTNPALPLKLRTEPGGKVVLDGGLKLDRILSCDGDSRRARVRVRGVGQVAYDDMPQIVVRTPRAVKAYAGGAVFGVVGRSASVDLTSAGCGDWTVGDTEGQLKLVLAGSGDIKAGRAGSLRSVTSGSGDISAKAVAAGASISIGGSGDVDLAAASGSVDVTVAGSGDVAIGGGRAQRLKVNVAGSGDVTYDGEAGAVEAVVMGSGDVEVRRATGPVRRTVMGSGEVRIGSQTRGRP